MKIKLGIPERKECVEVDAEPFSIRLKKGLFCVTTPMHDDWLQTVDFDLGKVDAAIQRIGPDLVLGFPNGDAEREFKEWLTMANSQAQHGYKTMWP